MTSPDLKNSRLIAERDQAREALKRVKALAEQWRTLATTEVQRADAMLRTDGNVRPHVRARVRAEMAREHAYALFAAIDDTYSHAQQMSAVARIGLAVLYLIGSALAFTFIASGNGHGDAFTTGTAAALGVYLAAMSAHNVMRAAS